MSQDKADGEPRSFHDDDDDLAKFATAPIDDTAPLRIDCPGDVAVI